MVQIVKQLKQHRVSLNRWKLTVLWNELKNKLYFETSRYAKRYRAVKSSSRKNYSSIFCYKFERDFLVAYRWRSMFYSRNDMEIRTQTFNLIWNRMGSTPLRYSLVCNMESLINAKELHITIIQEPDAKRRANEIVSCLTDHRLFMLSIEF